jgi:hypothetical protein
MPAQALASDACVATGLGVFASAMLVPVVGVEAACASVRVGVGTEGLPPCDGTGVGVGSVPQAVSNITVATTCAPTEPPLAF